MPNLLPTDGGVRAVVDGPVNADRATTWQVGHSVAPSAPDPAAARAARLEARLAVYAQYAAVVAEEAAAAVAGDDARRAALHAARGATAEHFAELREAADAMGATPGGADASVAFADALTDALHELRHQDAVDNALARRLRALHDIAGVPSVLPPLLAGGAPPAQLDVRF